MPTTSPSPESVEHGAHREGLDARDRAQVGTRRGASHIDPTSGPITGPLPVLSLVDGHLQVTVQRGVTIVALDGALDDHFAESVVDPIRRAVERVDAVVLDIDHVTLLDRTGIEAVLDAIEAAPAGAPRSLVAGRLSGRLVLERWDVHERFVVFTSVADALQALAFAESGYGTGWDPAPPSDPPAPSTAS